MCNRLRSGTTTRVAFDDTRTLIDRPFSLWERVHGETVGLARLSPEATEKVWRSVGRELARLHLRVTQCADPNNYLDDPARPHDVEDAVGRLVDAGTLASEQGEQVVDLARVVRPSLTEPVESRFIHDDVQPMNIMCTATGDLLALIDWGDAGWGDPVLDFAAMPVTAVPAALAGHETEAPGFLGAVPEARVAWYKLVDAVDDLFHSPERRLDLDALRRLLPSGSITG